jgi:hypothetical protein
MYRTQTDWQNGSRKKMVMQEEARLEKQDTESDNRLQPFQITVIFLDYATTLFQIGAHMNGAGSCRT